MYVVTVSNGYVRVHHGTWQELAGAEAAAARWNRVFERRGQPVRATAGAVLDTSAATRDQLVEFLVADLAARAAYDERSAADDDEAE